MLLHRTSSSVAVALSLASAPLAAIVFTSQVAPSRAAGRGLHCGSVVTHSVRLDRDIVGCKSTGLTVARSGVTIDFNGHTVGGLGEAVGIHMVGVSGVKLRNGTVRGFELGLLMNRAPGSRIVRMRILGSADRGARVTAASRSVFRGVERSGNSDLGVNFVRSHRLRIIGLKLGGNGDVGILLDRSHRNAIRRVRLVGNGDAGVRLVDSNRNRLRRLTLIRNGDAGILLEASHHNRIIRNEAVGSSDSGIGLEKASGNVVVGNSLRGNAEGITADGGKSNCILHNRATFNGGAGIEIAAGSSGTRVGHNRVHCNLGDGIHLEAPEEADAPAVVTRLAHNTATCNGGIGIKVIAQRIDAPVHWAAKNNDDLGCLGVRCAPVVGPVEDCQQEEQEKKKTE
jgi:parallel beta-helix repeat protein